MFERLKSWLRPKVLLQESREIQSLREQLGQLRLQGEIAVHKAQMQLQESISALDVPYDLVNPWSQFFDGQNLIFPLFPSRWDSRQFPSSIWISEAQLDLIRYYSRYVFDVNLPGHGIIEGLINYVLHTGFDYRIKPRVGGLSCSEALTEKVQRFVDDFLNQNKWQQREVDMFKRSFRDGEALGRVVAQESGVSKVCTMEPESVRAPHPTVEWYLGVRTDAEDKETPLGYWWSATGITSEGEELPALSEPGLPDSFGEVYHIKRNVDLVIRRGLSEFFAPQELLMQTAKLLRASTLGEAMRQAIGYIRQHAQAPASAIMALQSASTDFNVPIPTGLGTSRQQPVQQVVPGAVIDVPQGLEHKPHPSVSGSAENAKGILMAGYQAISAYFQVPTWMVSGEGGDVNFAQGLVQESPFVRNCERNQKFYTNAYRQIVWRAVAIGAEQGILPQDVLERVDLEVIAKPVTVRDPQKETERNKVLSEAGILSDATWATREDLDIEHERAEGAKRREMEANPTPESGSDTPSAQYKQATGQTG